jgi:DNA-directed RNA polymerase subunit RPC12/RpoP
VAKTFTGYKSSYDFPNVMGEFVCSSCKREGKLPANYCMNCGKELEKYQKQGLKN